MFYLLKETYNKALVIYAYVICKPISQHYICQRLCLTATKKETY